MLLHIKYNRNFMQIRIDSKMLIGIITNNRATQPVATKRHLPRYGGDFLGQLILDVVRALSRRHSLLEHPGQCEAGGFKPVPV